SSLCLGLHENGTALTHTLKKMKRRHFVQYAGLGPGALLVPSLLLGNTVPVEALLEPGLDVALKKNLADVALNTAKSLGASYADVRIGRYLNRSEERRVGKERRATGARDE